MAYGLALALLWRSVRPGQGDRTAAMPASRLPGLVLAAAWAWTGVVFHARYFASINFVAPVYAALFLIEALLLAWSCVARGGIALGAPGGPIGSAGVSLLAYAIAGYPVIAALAGDGVASTRVVFLAPGPTAVFTLGMLVLAGRTPAYLLFVPVLWTLIEGASAWMLGVPEDMLLPLLGPGVLALTLWKNRRRPVP